jgi:hypothetical protein
MAISFGHTEAGEKNILQGCNTELTLEETKKELFLYFNFWRA